MITVKLIAVGKSIGFVLPRDLLERLHLHEGDVLKVVETPNGMELIPRDPEIDQQKTVADEVMRSDHNVLKELGQ
jgi:putative addiction module antidote